MKKISTSLASLALVVSLTACTTQQTTTTQPSTTTPSTTQPSTSTSETTTETTTETSTETTTETTTEVASSEMFTARDKEIGYDESSATAITLGSESVTITQAGVYVISGTLSEGQIIVDVADTDKVQIVLDNATITSSSSAPIYVKSANKVFVTLKAGTTNTLSTTGTFVADSENNVDGVIFSKSDLTLNGTGSLVINSAQGNGIVGKDDVVFTSGTYTISALNNGVEANNSVRIADGSFEITSGNDGIQVEHEETTKGFFYMENGTLTVQSQGDAISPTGTLEITGGTYNLTTGSGAKTATTTTVSQKGLKSDQTLTI
ncbi:MAG: carbohydrate-binding domain-containing protein, partial [Culicoidibacterales bacterium]